MTCMLDCDLTESALVFLSAFHMQVEIPSHLFQNKTVQSWIWLVLSKYTWICVSVSVKGTCGASQACTRWVRTFLRLQHTLSMHDEIGACEMVDLGGDVVSTGGCMVRHVEMHQ